MAEYSKADSNLFCKYVKCLMVFGHGPRISYAIAKILIKEGWPEAVSLLK